MNSEENVESFELAKGGNGEPVGEPSTSLGMSELKGGEHGEEEAELSQLSGGKRSRSRKNKSKRQQQKKSRKQQQKKSRKQQQKKSRKQQQKKGGKRSGLESAVVPLGLLALQQYTHQKMGKKTQKNKSRKNKRA
tara:strand:- start:658 stop:1062 length:405 start_codon:yes stop_codon:yes gene_type:complete